MAKIRRNKEVIVSEAKAVFKFFYYAAVAYAVIDYLKLPVTVENTDALIKTLLIVGTTEFTAYYIKKKAIEKFKRQKRKLLASGKLKRKFERIKFVAVRASIALILISLLALGIEENTQYKPVSFIENAISKVFTGTTTQTYAYEGQMGSDAGPAVSVQPQPQEKTQLNEVPTKEEIFAYIDEVFGSEAANAKKIIETCENTYINSNVYLAITAVNHNPNGTTDHGLFQLNSVHKDDYGTLYMHDWRENVRVAFQILINGGWGQWACSERALGIPSYK